METTWPTWTIGPEPGAAGRSRMVIRGPGVTTGDIPGETQGTPGDLLLLLSVEEELEVEQQLSEIMEQADNDGFREDGR